MHLLLFAKNFLMLYAKLSNIHILQGTLPTYLNIHTYLQSIFATYLLHIHICKAFCYLSTPFERHFCYMFTFYSHIWSYTWEAASCYVHSHIFTLIWKAISCLHIHWKGNFCITNSYFWKAISCHIFLFWEEKRNAKEFTALTVQLKIFSSGLM